jgi:hypothetical protein
MEGFDIEIITGSEFEKFLGGDDVSDDEENQDDIRGEDDDRDEDNIRGEDNVRDEDENEKKENDGENEHRISDKIESILEDGDDGEKADSEKEDDGDILLTKEPLSKEKEDTILEQKLESKPSEAPNISFANNVDGMLDDKYRAESNTPTEEPSILAEPPEKVDVTEEDILEQKQELELEDKLETVITTDAKKKKPRGKKKKLGGGEGPFQSLASSLDNVL